MVQLQSRTDPDWARRAAEALPEILLDHAHLEKKAAGTAINLIFRYPNHPQMMIRLSELAREELQHFEDVFGRIKKRGEAFTRLRPSPYAGRLMELVDKQEPRRLRDTLLVCSIIEARSCERMRALAAALDAEPELQAMYRGLVVAEGRHHKLYVQLAKEIFDADEVAGRLAELCAQEAEIIAGNPKEPRFHNA